MEVPQRPSGGFFFAEPGAKPMGHEGTYRAFRRSTVAAEVEQMKRAYEDHGELAGTNSLKRRSTMGSIRAVLSGSVTGRKSQQDDDARETRLATFLAQGPGTMLQVPAMRPPQRASCNSDVSDACEIEDTGVLEKPIALQDAGIEDGPGNSMVAGMSDAWHHNAPEIPGTIREPELLPEQLWTHQATDETHSIIKFQKRDLDKGQMNDPAMSAQLKPSRTSTFLSSHSQNVGPFRRKLQYLVRRAEFDVIIGVLIVINAIAIGMQTDIMTRYNLVIAPAGFRVVEGLFCVAFTLELGLRFFAFGTRFFRMFEWRWNVFDCVIVFLQLFETFTSIIITSMQDSDTSKVTFDFSILRVFRILRLVRIVRVIRVLRFIADLRTLVYSVFGTFKQFLWTVMLIFLLVYITGVLFTQIVADFTVSLDLGDPRSMAASLKVKRHFGSLSRSILSLFASITGGVDWEDMVDPLIEHIHPVLAIIFCAYIAFGVFALLNVVTGLFVQSAMTAALQDRESYLVNHVRELFVESDADGSGVVSWGEFQAQLNSKSMKEYFKHLDIDISEAQGLFSLLDSNSDGEITADEFLNGSLRLRGQARALEMEVVMRAISDLNVMVLEHGNILPGVSEKVEMLHNVLVVQPKKKNDIHLPAARPEPPAGRSSGQSIGFIKRDNPSTARPGTWCESFSVT